MSRLIDADEMVKKGYDYATKINDNGQMIMLKGLEKFPTVPAIVIPKGASNGDMITNTLKQLVPMMTIEEETVGFGEVVVRVTGRSNELVKNVVPSYYRPIFVCSFKKEFWDAKYESGVEE